MIKTERERVKRGRQTYKRRLRDESEGEKEVMREKGKQKDQNPRKTPRTRATSEQETTNYLDCRI